ncbi:MAG: lipid-binding SYLF domain-containing protein [Acidobacteriota bacterium]|nr:lipid-binding SYLF domain-containing protein [Acidobacteriota bacterium]
MAYRTVTLIAGITAMLSFSATAHAETVSERLGSATVTLNEIMSTPDKGIPQDLLNRAHCIAVVPGVRKAAFVVGGKYGRGFLSCREGNFGWSSPGALRMEGGSIGWQIGASETDVILLVMNETGMHRLLQSKFTLGASADVAAGPVGRTASAETDAKMTAQILSWSRSRGVFAGVSLNGATLRDDIDENKALYGKRLNNRQIVMGKLHAPRTASEFIATLNRYSR